MDARKVSHAHERTHDGGTEVERELVVTRTINGLTRIVFEAWTTQSCSSR
jgi:hypothetical protein